METRTIWIDPKRLVLLKLNARFMRQETFTRLVENLRRDRVLTQLPFCAIIGYHSPDEEIPRHEDTGEPIYEVLSGNHRVKAAITAGLELINVQVTDDPLTPDERRAVQLSHNSISGEDDPEILKTIYDAIEDVGMRVYSGLDDRTLQLMIDTETSPLSEANLDFQKISMLFLPPEVEEVMKVWELAKDALAGSKLVWLARLEEYEKLMVALEQSSRSYGVRNTATALMLVLEIFTRHLGDLAEGYLDEPSKNIPTLVPVATAIGTEDVKPDTAKALRKALDLMASRGEIPGDDRQRGVLLLAQAYLASIESEHKESEHAQAS